MRLLKQASLIPALLLCGSALATAKPTLWIIGDSTVRNGTAGQQGWGDPLVDHFDPDSIQVINRAIGGRSSRSFLTQGRWDAVLAHLQPGDHVLIQFGHNDGGEYFKGARPRASIKGIGDDTIDGVVEATGEHETVHSFGWYLKKYATDTLAKGATPIILSPIPRNRWDDGRIIRNDGDYGLWARQAAESTGAHFIPFNSLIADACESIGEEETAKLFAGSDHTHTNHQGAAFNAGILASAVRNLEGCELRSSLLSDQLWIPSIFSDHMVLQQGLPLPLWGRTLPHTRVTARIHDSSASTEADANGHWKLTLPALSAGGPHQLKIDGAASTTFSDVLIGEVWLCAGQSNMDFTVAPTEKRYFAGTRDWKQVVEEADHPRLRMFTAEWTMHESPRIDIEGQWETCTPDKVGDFSAVAYFFGLDLKDSLDVPVGLITCAYGASTAEAWISRETLASHPQLKPLLDAFGKKRIAFRDNPASMQAYGEALRKWRENPDTRNKRPKHPDPVQDQHNPNVLFNGMIAPVAPYGIRGLLWYQGESNVGTRHLYPALQSTLVEDWRAHWNRPDLPFYFVQLANYKAPSSAPEDSSFASMREAQSTTLSLPHTGMAVTIDIGEEKDIHPRNKQDVGHRLARLALAGTYGKPVVATGPVFRSQSVEGSGIRLHFDQAEAGLISKGGALKHFAIAGKDRQFVWAEARIEGSTVIVHSDEVPEPVYVRYAWADNPAGANLFNKEDLPASPFRTDP